MAFWDSIRLVELGRWARRLVHPVTLRDIRRRAKRNSAVRRYYYQLRTLLHRLRLFSAGRTNRQEGLRPDPQRMVWIFCTGRSGSTWLRGMLAEVLSARVWGEPKVGQLFGRFHSRANEAQLSSPNFVMGRPTQPVWIKSLRHFVLEAAWAAHPDIASSEYLIVKEPDGAVGAPLISEALPESRLIVLVRDPRDVAASALDARRKGGWKLPYGGDQLADENPDAFIERSASDYRLQIEKALQAYEAHEGPKAILHYEELRENIFSAMKDLLDALELPVDPDELSRVVEKHSWKNIPEKEKGAGKFYRKGEPGSWREDLTENQARIVEEATAPLLERLFT